MGGVGEKKKENKIIIKKIKEGLWRRDANSHGNAYSEKKLK